MTGLTIGIIGLALTVLLCGVASGVGLLATGKAAAGVLAEDPKKFSKIIVMCLLPATQGIYGFIIAILGANYLPTAANLQAAGIEAIVTAEQITAQGWDVFFACVPMMLGGAISAWLQGKTAATTILAVGKRSEIAARSVIFPAMIEFYALLGLVVSIIMLGNIPVSAVADIVLPQVPATVTETARLLVGVAI